jgi:hypothetical protein
MKTIPALVAATLVLVLVVSPLTAHAVGSITFSSPASGSSFRGSASYTISGSVSPAPGGPDGVFLSVKNPGGSQVDAGNVPANAGTGAFSFSTAVGGSNLWTTGTYTITATDSFGATGSTTFTYTAPGPTPVASQLNVHVDAATPDYAGQSVGVAATVTWANGSLATVSNWLTAEYFAPGSTTPTPLGSPTAIVEGSTIVAYAWTVALPSSAADGLYLVHLQANATNNAGYGSGSFTVNSQIASKTGLASIASSITALQSSVASISTAVTGLQTSLTSISTSVSSLSGLSGQITTLGNQVTSAANGISTTQTYVLVVAVLAAITLVLELAVSV